MVGWLVGDEDVSLTMVHLNVLALLQLDQVHHPQPRFVNKFVLTHLSYEKNNFIIVFIISQYLHEEVVI